MGKNIGFVSTRFSGTDGVTLEASKWAEVLKRDGHRYYWFAGLLDRKPEKSFFVPEAHFQHEKNKWIDEQVFGKKRRNPAITDAFLEAVYFKKPLLINRYVTFVRDIEPKGFDLTVMDGYLTLKTVKKVREVLESPERRENMVNTNYEIAKRHYSFAVLHRYLNMLLTNFFGVDI